MSAALIADIEDLNECHVLLILLNELVKCEHCRAFYLFFLQRV